MALLHGSVVIFLLLQPLGSSGTSAFTMDQLNFTGYDVSDLASALESRQQALRKAECMASGSADMDAGDYYSFEDQFFLVVMGSLVFFMQAGFAALEAGSTGSSSVTSILFKNLADVLLGSFVWWAVGYAFAYGKDNGEFIGSSGFFLTETGVCEYAYWFYQWTFAATATTIVSGAMAGRTQLVAYATYCIFITAFIYPTVVHWTWTSDGWLSKGGYVDYAGSGIVHCVGGTAALVGAWFVGPRGTKQFENNKNKADIPGHSMPLVALGTLILFFGFIGFNGGSVLSMDSTADALVMSISVVNTVLAASGGGLAAELINRLIHKRKFWSLMQMCNGVVAGMVAICAGANDVWPWAAFVIGLGGGASFKLWSETLMRLKIDDAIDAAPVHLGAGLWGVVATALFARNTDQGNSVFYDSNFKESWLKLSWALAGCLTICVWTGGLCAIMFYVLNKLGCLRVSDEHIEGKGGLDYHEHGELAYVGMGLSKNKMAGETDISKNDECDDLVAETKIEVVSQI